VFELRHEIPQALAAARQATVDEPDNWTTWTVLSRLEAEHGNPGAAIAAFRRARSLNPTSQLFAFTRRVASNAP
jgi:cytochrome c-type biogenesis protein CcmH/NrfG